MIAKTSLIKSELKMTATSSNVDHLTMEVSKSREKNYDEARNYQVALFDIATKENIIICLPTGSGKTYIARSLCKQYLPSTIKNKQKIIFLARTVALVKQQANYFKLELDSADKKSIVSEVTGEMNPDDWMEERWTTFMEDCYVVFMTPDVLRNAAIKHSHIKFHQISLLIFDECHHAVKYDPMAMIMDEYTSKKTIPGYKLPRVIGLTATIIMGTSKCHRIPVEVEAIEKRMNCRAVTHANYADVLKYSTKFQETYVTYACQSTTDSTIPETNQILNIIDEFIGRIEKEFRLIEDSRKVIVDTVNHNSLKSTSQLYNKEKMPSDEFVKPLKEIKKQFDIEGIGFYAGKLTASLKRAHLKIQERKSDGEFELLRIETILTVEKIIKMCDEVMSSKPKIQNFLSNKVKALFRELIDWNKTKGLNEDFCGIVFCKERITAQILHWIFHDVRETDKEFHFLRPHFVIGASRENNDIDEFLVTLKKQQHTIERFRKKELNLIFSTNVLEEGIDIPVCNFVLRFDPIETYTSYVQSMGRARKQGSIYYILSKDGKELQRMKSKIEGFKSFNVALSEYLRYGNHIIDEIMTETSEEEEPCRIDANNPDSPKITSTAAIDSVYQYCQTLSCDRYVSMDPWSWYERITIPSNGKTKFVAYVQLPSNAIIKGIFKGQVMDNKNKAKRSAFLEVCKQLYLNGAFDNKFFPVLRPLPENVTKLLEEVETDKFRDGNKVGTRKATKWYAKKIADCLSCNPIEVGAQFSVYIVSLTQNSTTESYSELYNFKRRQHAFGILSRAYLDEVPAFVLDGRHAKVVCCLNKVVLKGSTQLTAEEISKINAFQDFLFFNTLNIPIDKTKSSVNNMMLVVPLWRHSCDNTSAENQWSINWNLIKNVEGTDLKIFTSGIDAKKMKMEIPVENYDDAVVIPTYLKYSNVKDLKLYCGYKLRYDLHADSCMDESKFGSKTFRTHYNSTYALQIEKSGPFLECVQMGRNLNYLTWSENHRNKSQNSQQIMIPEFVNIFPIPSSLLIQAHFLPSAVHRTMRLVLSKQLQFSVASETQWEAALLSNGDQTDVSPPKRARLNSELKQNSAESKVSKNQVQSDPENKVLDNNEKVVVHVDYIHPNEINDADIKNHQEWKFGNVRDATVCAELLQASSNEFPKLVSLEDVKFAYPSMDTVTDLKKVGGPSCQEIMEALTLGKANDSISLENLEVIGDSFLKIVVTIHIYCEFPDCDEGQLTQIRNKLISNSHLFSHGTKRELGEYLSGGIYFPNLTWLPPYLQVTEFIPTPRNIADDEENVEDTIEDKQLKVKSSCSHSKLGDKDIADCVEALIGQYFLKGGTEGGLSLMSWIGLRGPIKEKDKPVKYTRRQAPEITYRNPETMLIKRQEEFLPYINELEDLIQYNFKNQWLVVEAFTHPSYLKNTLTDGYQRLEYLGDAVLDFLITNHICRNGSKRTPGELTDLRSALVNNITFGSLVVRYGIHHNLLCQSQPLSDAIDSFVIYQQENGHAVTGHFTLLNDLECAKDVDVPKTLGDMFESLAGAVFLDSGMSFDTTWKVFYRLMKHDIDVFTANTPKSPVRECYEKLLKFVVDSTVTNPLLQGMTVVNVEYNGTIYSGCGRSVKQAKQAAAKYVISSNKEDFRK